MKSRSSNSNLIDKKVYWSMAIFAAIFLAVLSFQIKNYEPCTTVEIIVKPGPLYVGELIQFKALSKREENYIQWDFGGQSKNGNIVSHTFNTPGRYEVSLQTSKQCSGFKTIYVAEAPKVEDEHLKPKFNGPLTVEVGVPAVFEDETPNATQWEWRFGETNGIDASKQKVTYTFQTPGTKTVILIVNGKLQDELMVLVTPKPINNEAIVNPVIIKKLESVRKGKWPTDMLEEQNNSASIPKPMDDIEVETKFPDVSIMQLEAIVEGIVEGEMAITELSAYACGGQNMLVNYNGKVISLKELQIELWEIKKKNKIRNLKITLEKDPIKNCITAMNISLKKKWL